LLGRVRILSLSTAAAGLQKSRYDSNGCSRDKRNGDSLADVNRIFLHFHSTFGSPVFFVGAKEMGLFAFCNP
jgi:hypothetical protein